MATARKCVRYLIFAVIVLLIYHARNPHPVPRSLSITRSSYQWSQHVPFHPPNSTTILPTGKPRVLPKIQHTFPPQSRADRGLQESRRQAVKTAFQKCWHSYREHAWLKDELKPKTGGAQNTFGGWAATLVDSLDTLWIMDLKHDYYDAVEAAIAIDWAKTNDTALNMFETTIRHLGGLLAAHDLSGDKAILDKAIELGDMLYAGFDTPNRMPGFWLDFEVAKKGELIADDHEASASPCSLSLEFTRLSQLTGDSKYYDAIARITTYLDKSQHKTKLPGMWPMHLDMRNLKFDTDYTFTLGASADSLYEYLPKMFALLGGLEPVYEKLWRGAARPIVENILFRPMLPKNEDVLFSGTVRVGVQEIDLDAEGQHLGCFVGGMFGLAGRLFENQEWIDTGVKVTRGCIYAYKAFPLGIMPEIFNMIACNSTIDCEWKEGEWYERQTGTHVPRGFISARDPRYLLRPEAIESVFLLYRITGLKEFQDAAWDMFQAIQNVTETQFGNAAIEDVTVSAEPYLLDSMESFWLAETLKYFYLIFSPPDLISLDEYVLNTEAHPLKRPT